MGREKSTPTSLKYLYLGAISEPERLFIGLVALCGMTQAEAYRLAFNKPNISGVTASSAASKVISDSRLQSALWRLHGYWERGLVAFNTNTLKATNPHFYKY